MSTCRECGHLIASADRPRDFCCTACRRKFNNRRMLRGAVLYDALMELRFDRKRATGTLSLLCRMASVYRAEDKHQRGGRRSWDQNGVARDARFQSRRVGRTR